MRDFILEAIETNSKYNTRDDRVKALREMMKSTSELFEVYGNGKRDRRHGKEWFPMFMLEYELWGSYEEFENGASISFRHDHTKDVVKLKVTMGHEKMWLEIGEEVEYPSEAIHFIADIITSSVNVILNEMLLGVK